MVTLSPGHFPRENFGSLPSAILRTSWVFPGSLDAVPSPIVWPMLQTQTSYSWAQLTSGALVVIVVFFTSPWACSILVTVPGSNLLSPRTWPSFQRKSFTQILTWLWRPFISWETQCALPVITCLCARSPLFAHLLCHLLYSEWDIPEAPCSALSIWCCPMTLLYLSNKLLEKPWKVS